MLPSASTHRASPGHLNTQKWRGRVGLALVASLSVLAGMTDAIGFMASGDFVSFMSANTTRLAMAISVQPVPWSGMFIGAILGAVLEQHFGLKAMFASGLLAAMIGLLSLKIPQRWQPGYMPLTANPL